MHLIHKDLPTGRLSFTQVDTYLNCPKKYEWRYIIKPDIVAPSILMTAGNSIHDLIAQVLLAKKKNKKIDTKKLLLKSGKELDTQFTTFQNEHGNELYPTEMLSRILFEYNELFLQWEKDILPELAPTAIEKEINTIIGGYPFIMYIDAIHNDQMVIDWKFTASPKNKYQLANSLQLTVYSIGTELDRVAFGSLVRPKAGREKNWKASIQLSKTTRTSSERNWGNKVVKLAGDGIRAGNFPYCTPENFLCTAKYCDMYPLCRGKEEANQVTPTWCNAFV